MNPSSGSDATSRDLTGIVDRPTLSFLLPRAEMKISAGSLQPNVRAVLKAMVSVIDDIIVEATGAKSGAEFRALEPQLLARYIPVVLSLARFSLTMIQPNRAEALCLQVLADADENFRDRGPAVFGEEASRQARFTIWLFGKTNALVARIAQSPAPDDQKEADALLASRFAAAGLYSGFALDCLRRGLRAGRPVHPEVASELVEALRSAVNAYAIARQAYALRFPRPAASAEDLRREWDAEDEALMSHPQEPLPADV